MSWHDNEVERFMEEFGVDEVEASELVFQRDELEKDCAQEIRRIFKDGEH